MLGRILLLTVASFAGIITCWFVGAVATILIIMFVSEENFVYWCNFKTPPHVEYNMAILFLGTLGGVVCFCWEVNISARILNDAFN